jgi:hypothetical protein
VTTAAELQARIDAIEESYEFCLAYAAQGVGGEQASKSSAQVREFLERLEGALVVLADLFSSVLAERGDDARTRYQPFIAVLGRDAADALAAVRMVRAQPAVTSQMIDNLNALIHLRALLTDVFLIDEILNPRVPGSSKPSTD